MTVRVFLLYIHTDIHINIYTYIHCNFKSAQNGEILQKAGKPQKASPNFQKRRHAGFSSGWGRISRTVHIPVHEKKHRFFGPIKFNRDPKKKSGFRAFHRSVCAAGPAAPKSAIWPIRKNSTVERKKSSERPKASQLSAGKDFLRLIFREFWRCVFLNAFEGVTRSNFRVPENPENSSRKPVPGGWFPGSRARRTEEKCQNFLVPYPKNCELFYPHFPSLHF